MKNMFATIAFYSSFIHLLLVGKVASRHLQYNAEELVSDGGVDESILRLKGTDSECKLMYGFLPCSTNIPSHIVLIVIYEYLLYHGESYAGGDGRIFRVLGKNFCVTSFTQILDALPDSLILLVIGLSSTKEKAQDYVLTGAGLLAGSSILLLTLLWGACFICGRKEFYVQPDLKQKNRAMQLLTGSGVFTDVETSVDAKIMFFSLIPFVIILLPSVFGLSYSSQAYRLVLLVSLLASVICFISYFIYQIYEPRIWNRRLEYAEAEQKVEMHVPFYDVQDLMLDSLMIRQKKMEKRLENLVANKEKVEMFEEWVHGTRELMNTDSFSSHKSNQVVELLLKEKYTLINQMWCMMEHASIETLLKDGKPDESAIDRFFERIDTDNDGSITGTELKNFILKVNNEKILVDDDIAKIMMRHLDIDRNGNIDKAEFRSGVGKLLVSCNLQLKDNNQKTSSYKADEMLKAIVLLVVGIGILIVLAEPLVESVRQFSESVKIEPFYVSFILVPLATNARTAIAAIRAANQKRHMFTWHFSAEVLVVVIVCVIMGLLASLRSKFPNWTLLIAFPLYPLSMVFVYIVTDAFQFT